MMMLMMMMLRLIMPTLRMTLGALRIPLVPKPCLLLFKLGLHRRRGVGRVPVQLGRNRVVCAQLSIGQFLCCVVWGF